MASYLRTATIALIACLIGVPAGYWLMTEDPQFAVAIMLIIAVCGFFTIVFVMIVGSEHGHFPVEAKDSDAVNAWNERIAASKGSDD